MPNRVVLLSSRGGKTNLVERIRVEKGGSIEGISIEVMPGVVSGQEEDFFFHVDKNISMSKWEEPLGTGKGDEQRKSKDDIGPNTRVLKTKDRGTCFWCLQSGHHQARCTNPPVCYKCKKTGHMTIGCPEDLKKKSGLKLFDFGIFGQDFYSLQVPGLQLFEQQAAMGVLSIKEGVASVQRIEAELKHLIQANWD